MGDAPERQSDGLAAYERVFLRQSAKLAQEAIAECLPNVSECQEFCVGCRREGSPLLCPLVLAVSPPSGVTVVSQSAFLPSAATAVFPLARPG